jgi:transposase-like protein
MITSRSTSSSAPAGYRFPREVIAVAVRWYLRFSLSYRDVEELLDERGIDVDHLAVYPCVQQGQVIDALVSTRRDGAAARAFFLRAFRVRPAPVEVTTDRAPVYPRIH